ncbi:hypothetical protein QUF80_00135 [Desulfococcaceae bacterium HSG8]|nr:hypothetical protein [Desulfococcaceae bacterium HSG8]
MSIRTERKGPCWPEKALLAGQRCPVASPLLAGDCQIPACSGFGFVNPNRAERALLAGKGPDRGRDAPLLPRCSRGIGKSPACAGSDCQSEPSREGPCWGEMPRCSRGIDKSPHVRGSDLSIRTERKGPCWPEKALLAGQRCPVASPLLAGDWQIPRMCGFGFVNPNRAERALLARKGPAIAVHPSNPDTLMAISRANQRLIRSDDGGLS